MSIAIEQPAPLESSPYFHDLPDVLNGGLSTGCGEFACERPPDIFQKLVVVGAPTNGNTPDQTRVSFTCKWAFF
jgi:hypothetical protein